MFRNKNKGTKVKGSSKNAIDNNDIEIVQKVDLFMHFRKDSFNVTEVGGQHSLKWFTGGNQGTVMAPNKVCAKAKVPLAVQLLIRR